MGNSCCIIGESPVPMRGKKIVIEGPSSTYRTERIIGQGVYGKVFKCKKLDTKEIVALKIVRKDIKDAGKMEISNMNLLRQLNSDRCSIIKMTDHFVYRQQDCLVFEMLDKDLFEYMNDRDFLPMRVSEIRLITQQMLVALAALKSLGVVHTDIKPDNIMLVNHRLNPFKVKLIDFGMAKQVSDLTTGSWIQPNSYRAFEVTLGLPLNEGVDMWGLGCTLAFFYTGGLLFPSDSEYENMRAYVELYGQPENYLLNKGLYAKLFFNLTQESPEVIWKLKTPNQYAATKGKQLRKRKVSYRVIQSYDDLERVSSIRKGPDERKDIRAFISLLKQMMALDPNKRISPSEALRQDFITMKHLAGSSNRYVKNAQEMVRKSQFQPLPECSSVTSSHSSHVSTRHNEKKHLSSTITFSLSGENPAKVTPVNKNKLPVMTGAEKNTTDRVNYECPATRNIIYVKPYQNPALSSDCTTATISQEMSTEKTYGRCGRFESDSGETKMSLLSVSSTESFSFK